MIFAVAQDLVNYDVMCMGQQAGLYSTYFGRSPVLFNLITRASLVPFQYEPFSKVTAPFFLIENDDLYEKTLLQKIGGRTVSRLCCELNPIEMLEFFRLHREDLPQLGITRYWYDDVSLLLAVMRARVLAWKKAQRGRITRQGNGVIIAQFGSLLTREEEDFVLMMNPYHRDFKEAAE